MFDFLTAAWCGAAAAFIGIGVGIYWRLASVRRATAAPLVQSLGRALTLLHDRANAGRDAFVILEPEFAGQRADFAQALAGVGWWRARRLRAAWARYYGDDDPEGCYRESEYSPLLSNEMGKTNDSAKRDAIHRINDLIKKCS